MLLTLHQVAKELSCTYRAAWTLVKKGELVAINLSSHNIRIHPDSLDEYINRKLKEAIKSCQLQKTKKQDAGSVVSMIQRETRFKKPQQNTSQQGSQKEKRSE